MKKLMIVVLVALAPAGSLLAHHSLANYDTTKAPPFFNSSEEVLQTML